MHLAQLVVERGDVLGIGGGGGLQAGDQLGLLSERSLAVVSGVLGVGELRGEGILVVGGLGQGILELVVVALQHRVGAQGHIQLILGVSDLFWEIG